MATRKPTLTVTLPDGTIARRSTDRPYTHVAAYKRDGAWRAATWHEGERNADNGLRQLAKLAAYLGADHVEQGSLRLLPVNDQ